MVKVREDGKTPKETEWKGSNEEEERKEKSVADKSKTNTKEGANNSTTKSPENAKNNLSKKEVNKKTGQEEGGNSWRDGYFVDDNGREVKVRGDAGREKRNEVNGASSSARTSEKETDRREKGEQKETSPRSARSSRVNKLYRTPPTPAPEVLWKREAGFCLDCVAVSSTSQDYSRANPKLGRVLPPYNSQRDVHTASYFKYAGVDRLLKRAQQDKGGTSIEGPLIDKFYSSGPGYNYFSRRNQHGAGHSIDQIRGHRFNEEPIKTVLGYNGRFGYRRNTPGLRSTPSQFGVATWSPIY